MTRLNTIGEINVKKKRELVEELDQEKEKLQEGDTKVKNRDLE